MVEAVPGHHFVAAGVWDAAPLEKELLVQADNLVGGSDAVLVIDDTAVPKKGKHSVAVAWQYASALGKNANCQTLVSLTLARDEVPVMVALRLFLPESWTSDLARLKRAGVAIRWSSASHHIVMTASHGCFAHLAGNGGPHRSVGSEGSPQMEIGTMSAKFLPAIVAGLLLGTTALAAAQTLVYPQYGYNYGYNGYTPVYPPAVTFGFRRRPRSLLRTGLLPLCSCLRRPRLQWLERSRLEPLVSRNPTFIFDATAAPRVRLLLFERSTCAEQQLCKVARPHERPERVSPIGGPFGRPCIGSATPTLNYQPMRPAR